MTEEEKRRFIQRILNQFGRYEREDLTPEENHVHNEYYMQFNTSEEVRAGIEELTTRIQELSAITDYQEYYKTLVNEHITIDDETNAFKFADAGFEDLGDLYQNLEKNLNSLIENDEKINRFKQLKETESQKLEVLNNEVENKTRDYEEKTKDFILEKDAKIKEASDEETNRLQGVKKMQEQISQEISKLKAKDDSLTRRDELNEELENLNHEKDPYEREINGKSTADLEYNELLLKIEDTKKELSNITENNAKNISSLNRLEQVLKSYQDEETRAHTEYLAKKEEIENYCNEQLEKFDYEKKQMDIALQEQKESQDKLSTYSKELADAEDLKKKLQNEKVELEGRRGPVTKACVERMIAEDQSEISNFKEYQKVLEKLENTEYKKTPENIIKGLDIVKEAYESYHSHHNWFARLFKNWSNTDVGKDYTRYLNVRNQFMQITNIPEKDINEYLDHGKYTGLLAESKNAMENDAPDRVQYEIKDNDLNENLTSAIKSEIKEENPQKEIGNNSPKL